MNTNLYRDATAETILSSWAVRQSGDLAPEDLDVLDHDTVAAQEKSFGKGALAAALVGAIGVGPTLGPAIFAYTVPTHPAAVIHGHGSNAVPAVPYIRSRAVGGQTPLGVATAPDRGAGPPGLGSPANGGPSFGGASSGGLISTPDTAPGSADVGSPEAAPSGPRVIVILPPPLDEQQLAAVLAHERAHLTGHHSVAVTVLRGIAAVLPRLSLMTQGAQQVSRLLEMCADDIAARRHGRQTLLSGLMALCRAEPAEALAAADVAVLARAERLAVPPEDPVGARARAALASVVAFMTAGPLIMTALAASGALVCGAR
jgi:hypothetical protein